MKRDTLITAGFMIAVGLGMTGCQSPSWGIKNPFAREPKSEIQSPTEMDDMKLKAPPERYTKDDYIRKMEKEAASGGSSLAQDGSYGDADLEKKENGEAKRVAMTEKEKSSASKKEGAELTESEPAPGFGDYDVPSGLNDTSTFAPGSTSGSAGLRY